MNYTKEREAFIAKVAAEGLPITVIRTILAKANTLQRIAELQCSSALADRDRVKCPADPSRKFGKGECLCDGNYEHTLRGDAQRCKYCGLAFDVWADTNVLCHQDVPRIDVQEAHIKRQLDKLMAGRNGFRLHYQGDPRGAVVKLAVPSGAYDDVAREGLCVPAKGLPTRYWEQEERIMAGIYQMERRTA